MSSYQAHDDTSQSISDTKRKLGRLMLPGDLAGKRVLDIGCNEGYFSNLARERGATEVFGIDFVKSNIDFARQRYTDPAIQFLHQSWDRLPAGQFDLVLWTSAMHYDLDPRAVADRIFDALSPTGLFVLECGVIKEPGKEFFPFPRVADTRWYPTMDFLIEEILARFSVRQVAQSEIANGDFVPRSVFHCKKALPVVMLVRGASGSGKTTVAQRLKGSATKVVYLDVLVSRMGSSSFPHSPLEQFFIDTYNPADLGAIYFGIDRAGMTDAYAHLLAAGVAATDELVLFEGYMSDAQCAAVTKRLQNRAIVWDMQRAVATPPAAT